MDITDLMEGTRRLTRAALAEIPMHLDRLRVTPRRPLGVNNPNISGSSPADSPVPSPDELVIQQRGRRRLPVTWSPDFDFKRNSSFHSALRTPPKNYPKSPKLGVTLRSTPRKRLLLGDDRSPDKHLLSPSKGTPSKRQRTDRKLEFDGPLVSGLKGLSSGQLIHIMNILVHKHPELELEIRRAMPAPDLGPLEDKLKSLKSNIFKSLPIARLTSRTDSPAYSRVATHLSAFKECVIEQGKTLVESQHWDAVIKYVLLAWDYVKATPVWDNQPHNAQRKKCFKVLTNFCLTALKKGCFDKEYLLDLGDKLKVTVDDSDEIQSCLKFIEKNC